MFLASLDRKSSTLFVGEDTRRAFVMLRSFLLIALFSCLSGLAAADEKPISFNNDIRPILSENCFHCHGPDESSRAADLRLDEQTSAHQSAIVPGDADASEVLMRVLSDDPDLRMPPADSGKSVTAEEIELVRRWINQGASYQRHWSFEPIQNPPIPETKFADRALNPIDHFVFSRLEQEALSPQAEVGRELLLRRLSFDMTGLPPTVAELDAFLADTSDEAVSKVVDRLLASERYGERMAADWLDVARYSDTYGYQVDRDRRVWPWRDWVINAFNRNLPYDQFLTEQLAGDLLPDATRDQILATTFSRLHPQKVEGGSVPEEFRIEYVADRTQTVGTAFLGLTFECCRCHDHKYDPITQAEYYKLSAFFDNIDEAGLYSFFTSSVPTPTLDLPTPEQQQAMHSAEEQVALLEHAVDNVQIDEEGFHGWLKSLSVDQLQSGSLKQISFDEPELQVGRNTLVEIPEAEGRGPDTGAGLHTRAIKLTGDDAFDVGVGNFKRSQPFSVSLWMNTPDVKERAVIFHRTRAWTDAGSRGYQLLLEDGKLSWSLIHFWPGNAVRVRAVDPLPVDSWHHVAVTYDGSSRAAGLAIYVDGKPVESEVVRDNLTRTIQGGGGDNIAIGERFRDRGFKNGLVDGFSVWERQLAPVEVASLHDANSVSIEDSAAMRDYFRMTVSDKSEREQLQQAREKLNTILESIPQIMVMRELPEHRPTHLLNRGVYDQKRDVVEATTPASLAPFGEERPANRLGLAEWMTDSANPLVARVAVNRLWQICFGAGLVQTPEDFGSQGSPPSHPELLDWLAYDFQSHGWNIKRTLKLIVTSATYRQSSSASPELIKRDPANRLLARGPSGRLPAEMLRDNALFVSGLMVDRIGGPPAKPYEVEASFKPVGRDKGEGLYRRSLYTYWKRTSPAPAMMTLDAAKRDVCQVRREKTATPLQAFVLLNGPQYQEAARVAAERLIKESGGEIDTALKTAYRRLTSLSPDQKRLSVLRLLYQRQLARFAASPDDTAKALSLGDMSRDGSMPADKVAALASVINTLMNYDGCVTKR